MSEVETPLDPIPVLDINRRATDNVRFTDKYLEYMHEITDCPDPFILWGALLAISSCLSRSVYVQAGRWNIAPHIWVVLIGKSSSHKSTSIDLVEDLMQQVDSNKLTSHVFTEEAIFQALAENSNRFLCFDEAKTFFSNLDKQYNEGLKALFTTLYRKPNYSRTSIKHGTHLILNAYLTMGMATTPEWFRHALEDAETSAMSGFLARFLMVPYIGQGNAAKPLPPPDDPIKFSWLVNRMKEFSRIEQAFHYTPDALKKFELWYCSLTSREDNAAPMLGAFFEHFKNEAIHKLSVLFAIDRGEREITVGAFQEASMCLRYLEEELPSMMDSLTESKWDRARKQISGALKQQDFSRRDLSRRFNIHGNHLQKHLEGLLKDELIEMKDVHTGKRPSKLICWIGPRD